MSDHRSYDPIKPAASKKLAKKWDDRAYEMHRRKLRKAKPTVDTGAPKNYVHLQVKLKKLQQEEERIATIEKDNRILLERMSHIMRTKGAVDNRNEYNHKSLNQGRRAQEMKEISKQNQAILKRIKGTRPQYSHQKLEKDYDQSTKFKSQISRYGPGPSSTAPSSTSKPKKTRRQGKKATLKSLDDSQESAVDNSYADEDFDDSAQDDASDTKSEPASQSEESDRERADESEEEPATSTSNDTSKSPTRSLGELRDILVESENDQKLVEILEDREELKSMWRRVDYNGNNKVSLAELDKALVEMNWRVSKPAMLRAYKKTTLKDGDGDAWIEKKEFKSCLRNIFLFTRLWDLFDDVDSDDDRRIDQYEFQAGIRNLGVKMSDSEASQEFKKADKNGGGFILFKEFCDYIGAQAGFELEDDDADFIEDQDGKSKDQAPPVLSQKLDATSVKLVLTQDNASEEIMKALTNLEELKVLWKRVDYNGNGKVSLAELDKAVVEMGWEVSKPALLRAYKKTTLKDGDMDAWVEKKEFKACLGNIFFFNKLWHLFDDIDSDDDRRIDESEFKAGLRKLGLDIPAKDASDAFKIADKNGGGFVLFKEFCAFMASFVDIDLEDDDADFEEDKDVKKPSKIAGSSSEESSLTKQLEAFDELEDEIQSDMSSNIEALWSALDFNGNGKVSLAELDKWVVEKYPILNNKPALMRAYKQTTQKDGDGDDWIEKKEFKACIYNLFYFNKLFKAFDLLDTDDDRRLDLDEFVQGCSRIGLDVSRDQAKTDFENMDSNKGGKVLFDEFCAYAVSNKLSQLSL